MRLAVRRERQQAGPGMPTIVVDNHKKAPTDRMMPSDTTISTGNDDQNSIEKAQFQGWQMTLNQWDRNWLLIPKLIYLTLNCAIYATHNYTAMYFYRMWGLEVYQFGAVSSLAAVQFAGALFWAHLADKTGRHKSILLFCTVLYAFFFCLLELKPFDHHQTLTYRIVYSAVMYGISCFFVSSMFPLVDAQVFAILAKDPTFTKETFGRQRLWGTVGHGIVTMAVAVAIRSVGYAGIFIVLVLSAASFIFFVIVGIPSDIKIGKSIGRHGHHDSPSQNSSRANISAAAEAGLVVEPDVQNDTRTVTCSNRCKSYPAVSLLLNPHFFFLAVVIMFAGYVRSVMSNFLGFYMQQEMKQTEIMVAIAIMFRMASEIAIFFYNKQLLCFIGIHWMLIIAQVAGLLRVLAYSVLPPEGNWFYLSFAIELLKGTSTGCLISSGVHMANEIAPKGCSNTAQAYISGIYSGLSLAVGGALGGFIIYILPGHSVAGMFRVTFYMGLAALVLCIIKYSIIDRAILVPRSWRKPETQIPTTL